LLACATAFVLSRLRKQPWPAVGWLWFAGTLVPVICLVDVGMQERADRFTYIPHLGLLLAVVWLAGDLAANRERSQRVAAAAGGAALALAALLAARQTLAWRDTDTLFEHSLEVAPDGNRIAHRILADRRFARGEYGRAAGHAAAMLEISPTDVEAHAKLGAIHLHAGDLAAAEREFREVIRLGGEDFPQFVAAAHSNLALLHAGRGDSDEAERHYRAALRIDPRLVEAHAAYGGFLLDRGRKAEGIGYLREALRLRPDYPPAVERLRRAEPGDAP
jgi:tetratricopeptide (TPR) repeat protein